jgi:hypothetical protein
MSKLLDLADVVRGDGPWSAVAYDVEYDDQRPLIGTDVCTRNNTALIDGVISSGAVVYTIHPFGATVSAVRPHRCVPGDGDFEEYERDIIATLDEEAEHTATYVLYNGIPGWGSAQPYFLNSDVHTLSAGTTVQDTVPAVLDAFYGFSTGVEPILHLGLTSAVKLSAGNAVSPTPESARFYLAMDGTPIVVSHEYPTTFVGVTGPIKIKLGRAGMAEPQYYYDSQVNQNRTIFVAEQLLAIEFDATIAVRAT